MFNFSKFVPENKAMNDDGVPKLPLRRKEDFFRALKHTRDWTYKRTSDTSNYSSRIRTRVTGRNCCPIMAVGCLYGFAGRLDDFEFVATQMGMSVEFAYEVIRAADETPFHDPELRERLIRICKPTKTQL